MKKSKSQQSLMKMLYFKRLLWLLHFVGYAWRSYRHCLRAGFLHILENFRTVKILRTPYYPFLFTYIFRPKVWIRNLNWMRFLQFIITYTKHFFLFLNIINVLLFLIIWGPVEIWMKIIQHHKCRKGFYLLKMNLCKALYIAGVFTRILR